MAWYQRISSHGLIYFSTPGGPVGGGGEATGFFSFGAMALREAHSGSTVRNQAGPVGSESSVGDIKGLGKRERGRRRRNTKRAV